MNTTPRRWRRCLLPAVLVFVSGCGAGAASVQGTVTLDGAPVEQGYMTFTPVDEAAGFVGRASIVNGRYAIDSSNQMKPGVYRVEIHSQRKTGKQVEASSPAPKGTLIDEEVEAVPPRYNKDSTLSVELKAGANNSRDFPLTTK